VIEIRDAAGADAAAICTVVRRSIVELCRADHGGDPVILGRWLANKTPGTVAAWIACRANNLLVAVEDGRIRAAGCVTEGGEVTLSYVSPDACRRGLGTALMRALEQRAMALGRSGCILTSTETAHPFYERLGYADSGPRLSKFGGPGGYPMSKRLP